MRIACLLVPDLPLRSELRAHESLAGKPVVIASGTDPGAKVIAASPEALAKGVSVHGSVTRARSLCPKLEVRLPSPALERTARQALIDIALSFSPRIQAAPRARGTLLAEAAVYLDASGITALLRSEEVFATRLEERARTQGLPGIVAVAGSRDVAHLAARAASKNPQSARILPPENERAFLAALPIDWLDPGEPLASRLSRFGIQRVSDLLRLPKRGLTQRLGPEVLALWSRARGEDNAPPLPEWKERRLEESIDLEYPIAQLEPLLFVLRGVLSRLVARLQLRGQVCGPLDLELGLCDGGREERRIAPSAPTNDTRVLLRLLSLVLESHLPCAPLCRLGLSTEGQAVRSQQLDLFLPRGPDPANLDRTLSELEALCGPGRVGAPKTLDDHRPDRFAIEPFRVRPRRTASPEKAFSEAIPAQGVRALRPPVPARVRLARGIPSFLHSAVASGEIVGAAGPFRISGHWWNECERFAFDYFDIQVENASVLRLRFDWKTKCWQIDGIYD